MTDYTTHSKPRFLLHAYERLTQDLQVLGAHFPGNKKAAMVAHGRLLKRNETERNGLAAEAADQLVELGGNGLQLFGRFGG